MLGRMPEMPGSGRDSVVLFVFKIMIIFFVFNISIRVSRICVGFDLHIDPHWLAAGMLYGMPEMPDSGGSGYNQ